MSNQNWGDVICASSNWSVLNYNCAFADKGLANHGTSSALGVRGSCQLGLGVKLSGTLRCLALWYHSLSNPFCCSFCPNITHVRCVCTSLSLFFRIASNKGLGVLEMLPVWEYKGVCSVVYIAAVIMRLRSACWRGLLTQIWPYLAKNWPISRLLVRRWKHLNGSFFCGPG